VISSLIIVNDQPFRIAPQTSTITTSSHPGLSQTCRQSRIEYAQLLRRAAFRPGTKTIVPVHNFDFTELIAFAKTLKPNEVAAASRNRNLVVNLFVFDVQGLNVPKLVEWVKLCEKVGLEVGYVLQWTAFDGQKLLKGVEAAVGSFREGRKITQALRAKSVKGWSWEGYCRELKECGR
jgi:hypothetical protein